jgi:hypothetical protein
MVSKVTNVMLNINVPLDLVFRFPARTTNGNLSKVKNLATPVMQVMSVETHKRTCALKIVFATETKTTLMKGTFMVTCVQTDFTLMEKKDMIAKITATLAIPVTSAWEVKRLVSALPATSVLKKPTPTLQILTTRLTPALWVTIVSLDPVLPRDALSRPTHSRKELSS